MEATKILTKEKLDILSKIEPEYQCYFKWFLALTEMAHPTFKVNEISDKIEAWCIELGADVQRDKDLNIVVRIPANNLPPTSPVSAIQTHIDMVWVGEYEKHNRIKVEYQIKEDSKRILVAPKSTLGADDGFGVALCLEMIEKRKEFTHGPMELIMTSDEESGLIGVKKLPKKGQTDHSIKPLEFKYLINCDSLSGDKIYIGSLGGMMFNAEYEVDFETGIKNNSTCKININGCLGGHSGAKIHLGRANPIKLIAQIMKNISKNHIEYRIYQINGGHIVNAIPNDCMINFSFDKSEKDKVKNTVEEAIKGLLIGYQSIETNMKIDVEFKDELSEEMKLMSITHSKELINVLSAVPHGVIRIHPIYTDTVDSSINLSQVHLTDKLRTEFFSRAATECEMDKIQFTVESVLDMCRIPHKLDINLCGQPWSPVESKLSQMLVESASKIIGERKTGIVPITIEPAQFLCLGYKDSQYASVCPSIPLAHCIGEWMDIDEAMKWRKVIFEVISKLNE